VKGGKSAVISDDDLERYRQVPHVQIEIFENANHEIHKPDYERFMGTVERFLRELDSERTHIAIQEQQGGKPVEWLEHVSDEQYRKGAQYGHDRVRLSYSCFRTGGATPTVYRVPEGRRRDADTKVRSWRLKILPSPPI
jgi:hypothetical protein